jgi:hypothetical protein
MKGPETTEKQGLQDEIADQGCDVHLLIASKARNLRGFSR